MNRVYILSYWRNDVQRQLGARLEHLLAKSYPNLGWLWVVGDSQDETIDVLDACSGDDVLVYDIGATDARLTRRERWSDTATQGYALIPEDADYVLVHESDLHTPVDVVERLMELAGMGYCPVAGWPTLVLNGTKVFYDTWAYRKDGVLFHNTPPYHACYKPSAVFEVDSAGSVILFEADDLRGRVARERCLVEVCDQLRAEGRHIWVDPTLEVVQPPELWTASVLEP